MAARRWAHTAMNWDADFAGLPPVVLLDGPELSEAELGRYAGRPTSLETVDVISDDMRTLIAREGFTRVLAERS